MEGKMAKMARWRRHTLEFKRQVVEQMKTCQNINELARKLKVQRKLLYTWKYQLEGRPEPRHANLEITAEERKEKQLQAENIKLKLALAQKTLDIEFFRNALLRVENGRQPNTASGASASTRPSGRGSRSKAR